jgi:preprotein translocase subunit SecY
MLKKPNFEIYGFVLYLLSIICFIAYLVWGLLPKDALAQLGITYVVSRYWALAIPLYLIVSIIFLLFFTIAWDFINIPPLESCFTFTDSYACLYVHESSESLPPLEDIPLFLVK